MNSEPKPIAGVRSVLHIDQTAEIDFETLFKENYAPLCAFCGIKFRLSSEISEDIVQAAFLKLWESRQSILSPNAAKSYLYKIVTNSTLDFLKHRKIEMKRERNLLLKSKASILDKSYESIDFKKLDADVESALLDLPEQMRRIFILCKIEGLKYSEAAQHLNISVKTIETQMSRALVRIRIRLSGYLEPSLVALFCICLLLMK